MTLLITLGLMVTGLGVAHAQDGAPTVVVTASDTFGPMLTDPDGWTLYTSEGDAPGQSACYNACAATWPPLTSEADPTPPDNLPGTLSLVERDDGLWQVAYEGWPLYYFASDQQPGDAVGAGRGPAGARFSPVALGAPPPAAMTLPAPAQPAPPAALPAPPSFTPPLPASPPGGSPFLPSPPPVTGQAPSATAAATVPVTIMDFEFRPASTTVRVGDTVVWTNNGPATHSATSDSGLWDTRPLTRGQTGSFTFTAAGTFPYHCTLHSNMRGTIVVSAAGGSPGLPLPFPSSPQPGPNQYPGTPGYPGGTQYQYGPGYGGTTPYPNAPGYQETTPYPGGAGAPYLPVPGTGGTTGYPGLPGEALGAAATTVTVVAPADGSVALIWVPMPSALSYRIYQSGTSALTSFGLVQTIPQNVGTISTNAMVQGLQPGATYLLQVRAVDSAGTEVAIPITPITSAPVPTR